MSGPPSVWQSIEKRRQKKEKAAEEAEVGTQAEGEEEVWPRAWSISLLERQPARP